MNIIVEKEKNKEGKIKFVVGRLYKYDNDKIAPTYYICALIKTNQVRLINLQDGNRFDDYNPNKPKKESEHLYSKFEQLEDGEVLTITHKLP